jgi:hypothetical protein
VPIGKGVTSLQVHHGADPGQRVHNCPTLVPRVKVAVSGQIVKVASGAKCREESACPAPHRLRLMSCAETRSYSVFL